MASGLWRWEAVGDVRVGVDLACSGFIFVEHALSELDRRQGISERHPLLVADGAGLLLPLCFLLRPDTSPQFIYFQF